MHSSPKILHAYDKAYALRRKVKDEESWMLGVYFMRATASCLSKAKYPESPLFFTEETILKSQAKEDEEKAIQLAILNEKKWMARAKNSGLPETIIA
jgi:hypothetical protein